MGTLTVADPMFALTSNLSPIILMASLAFGRDWSCNAGFIVGRTIALASKRCRESKRNLNVDLFLDLLQYWEA